MKNRLLLVMAAFFVIATTVDAQVPQNEQDAQKMMDSIMNEMPEGIRAMMQQAMQQEENKKAQKQQAKKAQLEKNKVAQKEAEMEFYWRNKMASNTQGKFENWPHGAATIITNLYHKETKQSKKVELGSISAIGQITMNLPKLDFRKWGRKPITENSGEGDLMRPSSYELDYSNKNVTYFSTIHDFAVYQAEEMIGTLDIGNAIKPVVNLNAPCCFDKAGDGYTAHWVFMSQANTISGIKEYTREGVTDSGKQVSDSGKIVHDLKFNAGWNLILQRVEGNTHKVQSGIPDPVFWRNQYYTATTSLPSDAKYYFHSYK